MAGAGFQAWMAQKRRKLRLLAMPFILSVQRTSLTVPDDLDTTGRVFMTTFAALDQGYGVTTVELTGADAGSFEIVGRTLYLKAGEVLAEGDMVVAISAENGDDSDEVEFTLTVEAA